MRHWKESLANISGIVYQSFMQKMGLILECRGQCYDGAANIQSQKKGAASFILKESLRAVVSHCCSHNLNLSLSSSCKERSIDNILETSKGIIIFFNTSPKREGLLEYIYSVRCQSTETRKIVVGLCGTLWSEHDIFYERFYLAILFISTAFEVINGTHPELQTPPKECSTGWDAHVKREANALTKFEFIVGIIVLYCLLHPVAGLSNKLQGRNIDIIEAYESINHCIEDMEYMRENIDNEFDQILKQAESMAIKLPVQPSLPRRVARQNASK